MNVSESHREPPAFTVGITGHTKHGKSALIHCLADPDNSNRSVGDPQRGFSLNHGIASVRTTGGYSGALIEAPGHWQYGKQIIRSLCAVDMVVLVVAVDDGVTTQTKTLLDVFHWLDIRHGFVVLTKTDLADPELRELAEYDIRSAVKGSFLQDRPIVPFSTKGPEGREALKAHLDETMRMASPKSASGHFRMWIDQTRSFAGIGTVVCGTILSGCVRLDDPLVLLPENRQTRARSLEVYHRGVSEAFAGQRVGINLPGIDLSEVDWGMSLASPDSGKASRFVNVVLQASQPIFDRQPVDIHIGTMAAQAAVVLMQKETLSPGESGLAQLRFSGAVAAAQGDRFVLAMMNKATVIGGGMVLEISDQRYREANAADTIAYLKTLQSGRIIECIRACLRRCSGRTLTEDQIVRVTGLPASTVGREIAGMERQGDIMAFDAGGYCLKECYFHQADAIVEIIKDRISRHPLQPCINKEEIKANLTASIPTDLLDHLLGDLDRNNRIQKQGFGYTIPGFSGSLNGDQRQIAGRLLAFAEKNGDTPFSLGSFFHRFKDNMSKKLVRQVADYLCRQGELVQIRADHYLLPASLETIKQRVIRAAETGASIHLVSCMEILGYGRSKGTLIFEYLDKIGFTVRQGDYRRVNGTARDKYRSESSNM